METIDEILNGSDEGTQQVVDQQVDVVDKGQVDDQSTGVDGDQVAADDTNNQADDAQQQTDGGDVKSELKALAKERERIRQKEAALDAELARLADAHAGNRDADAADVGNVPLRELRKQYREALKASVYDPDDVEAEKLVEELEERIDAAQAQQVQQVQAQKAMEQEFSEVFADVHTAYPFLDPEHPKADADLNADINAFYDGLLKRGESKAVALRKAVDAFAPAQAKKLGMATTTKPAAQQKSAAHAAAGVAREKLKGGFSEVPGTGNSSKTSKLFTGPTPMEDILGRSST